jgi:hypothetical protein
METVAQAAAVAVEGTKGRRRRGKKRLNFRVPEKMPSGVRELWRTASGEAQIRAHQTCVEILSLWLGRKPREEVARSLSIPPLRVWQLSQMALSGMLAGLLKQPRTRRSAEVAMASGEDDPRALKKKIVELERRVRDQEDLIKLLAELPKPESEPPESTPSSKPAAKTRRKVGRRREAGGGSLPLDAPPAAG